VRAAIVTADHSFGTAEVPDPTPGPDELVLQVQACGICGSDLKAIAVMPQGAVLGHEMCGEVVAVGAEAADRWAVGQHVAAMPLQSCGRCRWCLGDEPLHCEQVDQLGLGGSSGAFAELVRVGARSTIAVGEQLGPVGALVEPLAVGLHAVTAGGVRPDDRVLVIGGGAVGACVSTWARRAGAGEVVVSDPLAIRRDEAGRFGATGVHDPDQGPPPAGAFDVAIECVGHPGLLQVAIDAVRPRGHVVVAGVCIEPEPVNSLGALMKEVDVSWAVYYRTSEFFAAAKLLSSGALDVEGFITSTVGLDGVAGAFEQLLAGSDDRKVLVVPR
jgi:2-desacetyl-2-hydroxyethyl bacteriochlorophyllide A dehydrogenase